MATGAFAQSVPSGGLLNQQIQAAHPTVRQPEKASPIPEIVQRGAERLVGGHERIQVRSVRFTGNTAVPSAELSKVLPPLKVEGLSIDDLNNIAEVVTTYYRGKGYPLAQAYFAEQQSGDGAVTLTVIEGRYGKVTVHNTSALRDGVAAHIIADNLCSNSGAHCQGALISDHSLQRAALLLGDQPGVTVTSTFKRGESFGTSDLDVTVAPDDRFVVVGGVDNFGNSSTGEYRGSLALGVNELLGIGDRLDVSLVGSGEDLWNAGASYSALVTDSGLRVGISGAHTHYLVGDSFAVLDANGIADTASAYATYPLIRRVDLNINVGLAYVHKSLHDNIGAVNLYGRSQLDNVVLSGDGNWTDGLLGGGYNRASLSYVHGTVSGLDTGTFSADQNPATGLFTRGAFNKVTFAVERQQTLIDALTLYTSVNGQYGDKNLSNAERFYIGGPTGVRAYSVGEGSGDSGVMGTVELRYSQPLNLLPNSLLTYGAFFDGGWIKRNQNPIAGTVGNEADYGGAGLRLGLENLGAYSVDLAWSHRVGERASLVEPGTDDHFWFQVSFQL